jgi:hypothetical protein
MTKRRNQQSFYATINGREYAFYCWTTSTRCGFCHTVATSVGYRQLSDTKVSYYNRTWERFDYETALGRAIDKCPKEDREELREQIIEKKNREETERCERIFGAFEKAYNSLNDANKQHLANSGVTVNSLEEAEQMTGIMKMMSLMQ